MCTWERIDILHGSNPQWAISYKDMRLTLILLALSKWSLLRVDGEILLFVSPERMATIED